MVLFFLFFFFQAEDGIRDLIVTGVQTCALPICSGRRRRPVASRSALPARPRPETPDVADRTCCSPCETKESSGERQRGRRTAKKPDELTPLHSITSSALASSVGGTVRPSAFAFLRLTTSWNFVGGSTGRSPGFVPLRTLSTRPAARLNRSPRSAP